MHVHLHLGTDIPDRPDPVWARRWFLLLIAALGLGLAVRMFGSAEVIPHPVTGPVLPLVHF